MARAPSPAREARALPRVPSLLTSLNSFQIQTRDRAWLQRDRLKTRDANWNGFVPEMADSHDLFSIH